MLEEIVLGIVIFSFFIIHYSLSSRGHKIERTVQFQKGENPSISCPYCGTLLRPSDQFCPNCDSPRKKYY